MKNLSYKVLSESKNVNVQLEKGLLLNPAYIKKALDNISKKWGIIADDKTSTLVAEPLHYHLREWGIEVDLLTFPSGEGFKSRSTKEKLEDTLFERGFNKDSALLAVGGGVVTDMTGFVASTFCRGIPYVNIPTTLLAMVDASLGGKTGVNTSFGKNLIGSIYQPREVWIDINTLKTLPQKSFIEGMAECIKHGAIASESYFTFLETHKDSLLKRDEILLESLVEGSCKIKGNIIDQDEKESGVRKLLNFGHTIAHAIESVSKYRISHGDAVSLGMIFESRLFVEKGEMNNHDFERLYNLIKSYGLMTEFPDHFAYEDLIKVMVRDKKSSEGVPQFVGIQSIGHPLTFDGKYSTTFDSRLLETGLKNALHCC